MSTLMHPSTTINKDKKGNDTPEKEYKGIIGSLLYLTSSRPNIVFVVCLCARFQSCPQVSHVTINKRILRYLVGTTNHGL